MVKEILLPDLGEGIDGADVSEVVVSVGDTVSKDDTLLVLESDKASMEIPAEDAGVIKEILVSPGDSLETGALLMKVEVSTNETLKNTNGVFRAKSEIINNIKSNGYLIVPFENKQHIDYWKNVRSDIKVLTFGMCNAADFFPTKININEKRISFYINSTHLKANIYINTSMVGEHNIKNILASCIAHYCLDLNLEKFAMIINSKNLRNIRLTKTKWIRGSILIDDSYNANPDSAKKSIDLLSCYKKRTFFILGDMLELGDKSEEFNKNLEEKIQENSRKFRRYYKK